MQTTQKLSLGSTPAEEKCASVGENNYHSRARRECQVFINQLLRVFPIPEKLVGDVSYLITSNPHDMGTYLDVCIKYRITNPEAEEYAYQVESDTPGLWDEQALEELMEAGLIEGVNLSTGKKIKEYFNVEVDDKATYYLGTLDNESAYKDFGLAIDRKQYEAYDGKLVWCMNSMVMAYGLTLPDCIQMWFIKTDNLKVQCVEGGSLHSYIMRLQDAMRGILING